MKNNGPKIYLSITSILSMLILLIGTTFSYFSITNKSDEDALVVNAATVNLELDILPKYVGHKLIPTNDKDIMIAYESECVDIYGYGACLAYDVEVSNGGDEQDLIGIIDFKVEGIENLSYMLLDENENIYLEKTSIKKENALGMSLGEHFVLGKATIENPTFKKFILIIWLTNLDEPQDEYDAGGTFSASVTYQSVLGNKLTGSINGYGEENGEVSKLEVSNYEE